MNKMMEISLQEEFGLDVPNSVTTRGFAPWAENSVQRKLVPEKKFFHFEKTDLKRFLLAMQLKIPLTLFGPTGCGKTEMCEQVAARLNWPAVVVSHHAKLFFQDLIAEKMMLDGDTETEFGPLTMAALYDAMYIADEFNLSPAATNAGYHTVLANREIGITPELATNLAGRGVDAGLTLKASDGFRFIMTANGGFSTDAGYKGTQQQNGAFRDRPIVHRMTYLPEDKEITMLMARFQSLAKGHADFIATLVRMANDLRGSHEADEFSVPISTRTLVNMLTVFMAWGGSSASEVQQAAYQALDMTVYGKLEDEDKTIFCEAINNHFAAEWSEMAMAA